MKIVFIEIARLVVVTIAPLLIDLVAKQLEKVLNNEKKKAVAV